jgi:hypothetical protein
MSNSIIDNITVPNLCRVDAASPSRRSLSQRVSRVVDIALEDIKRPEAIASAIEAQEDPSSSAPREAGERDPLELRSKILDDGSLNELRQ